MCVRHSLHIAHVDRLGEVEQADQHGLELPAVRLAGPVVVEARGEVVHRHAETAP